MKNKNNLVDSIVTQLSHNSNTTPNEDIISDLIDDYIKIACDNSNRNEEDEKLIPYVKQAVIMAYERIGAEAVTSSGEGSQSYSFIDIEEKLATNCRRIRILC